MSVCDRVRISGPIDVSQRPASSMLASPAVDCFLDLVMHH